MKPFGLFDLEYENDNLLIGDHMPYKNSTFNKRTLRLDLKSLISGVRRNLIDT
jgi:hypothetical protein